MVFLLRLRIAGITVRSRRIGRLRLQDRDPVIIRVRVGSVWIVAQIVVFLGRCGRLVGLSVVRIMVIFWPQTILLRAVVLLVSLTVTKRVLDAFDRVLYTRLDSPDAIFSAGSPHTVGCAAS